MNMGTSSRGYQLLSGYLLLPCLLIAPALTVVIEQTIPENNSVVCPGQVLQYTCQSNESSLGWLIDPDQHSFQDSDDVNATMNVGNFVTVLTVKNGSFFASTATNPMVSRDDNGTTVVCVGGNTADDQDIVIAERPASCSSTAVVPMCNVIPGPGNNSNPAILITLSTKDALMCVVEFQILFNGETATVPLTSPMANFTVSIEQGQPSLNGTIYTLDNESRMGQVPCIFDIANPTTVERIVYEPRCITRSTNVTVILSWMPTQILGCLGGDIEVEYIIDFNDTLFTSDVTKNTNYTLLHVPLGTYLEVTITPSLPTLGVVGPSLSQVVKLEKSYCVANNLPTTTTSIPLIPTLSPATSPTELLTTEEDDNLKSIIQLAVGIGVPIIILLIAVTVFAIIIVVLLCCNMKKDDSHKHENCNQEEAGVGSSNAPDGPVSGQEDNYETPGDQVREEEQVSPHTPVTTPGSGPHSRWSRIPQPALAALRSEFERNNYPSTDRKKEIANEQGLNYKKVNTWFNNERAKQRRNEQRVEFRTFDSGWENRSDEMLFSFTPNIEEGHAGATSHSNHITSFHEGDTSFSATISSLSDAITPVLDDSHERNESGSALL